MNTDIVKNDDVVSAVEKYYNSRSIQVVNWKIISLNEDARLGYLGDHFLIECHVHRHGQDDKVTFFVKTMPSNKMHRKLVEAAAMFSKEVLFYNHIADQLISTLSTLSSYVIPRCFFANENFMIMENLREKEYQSVDPEVPFSLDYFLVSIRSLARYHAASIVFEEKLGVPVLSKFPQLKQETFLNADPEHYLAPWHAASVRAAIALVPLLERYVGKDDVVKKTQEMLPELVSGLMKRMTAWPDARNVVCHGDLWINNILFQIDEDGRPEQAVLVDYQLFRYAPPATDIITFLMFSADKKFRDNHFNDVIREYHKELSSSLRQLSMDPDKVLPWGEFLRTIEEMKKYGLVLMSLEYPFSLAPAGTLDAILSDDEKFHQHYLVDRTPFAVNLFHDCEVFRTRFTEIMEELIDNYILT